MDIYRIKKVSDNPKKIYEIIKSFLTKGNIVLFRSDDSDYSEYSNMDLKDDIDERFDYYCWGIGYFYNNNEEILKKRILKALESCKKRYECNDTTEELYNQLIEQNDSIMEWSEIEEIKFIVYHMLSFENKNNERLTWEKNRAIYRNKLYFDEYILKEGNFTGIWYNPKNNDEILSTLKYNIFFNCIILEQNCAIENFSYGLIFEETADNYDIIVMDNKSEFMEKIVPKLKINYKKLRNKKISKIEAKSSTD